MAGIKRKATSSKHQPSKQDKVAKITSPAPTAKKSPPKAARIPAPSIASVAPLRGRQDAGVHTRKTKEQQAIFLANFESLVQAIDDEHHARMPAPRSKPEANPRPKPTSWYELLCAFMNFYMGS